MEAAAVARARAFFKTKATLSIDFRLTQLRAVHRLVSENLEAFHAAVKKVFFFFDFFIEYCSHRKKKKKRKKKIFYYFSLF
jgi:hypothetical protein